MDEHTTQRWRQPSQLCKHMTVITMSLAMMRECETCPMWTHIYQCDVTCHSDDRNVNRQLPVWRDLSQWVMTEMWTHSYQCDVTCHSEWWQKCEHTATSATSLVTVVQICSGDVTRHHRCVAASTVMWRQLSHCYMQALLIPWQHRKGPHQLTHLQRSGPCSWHKTTRNIRLVCLKQSRPIRSNNPRFMTHIQCKTKRHCYSSISCAIHLSLASHVAWQACGKRTWQRESVGTRNTDILSTSTHACSHCALPLYGRWRWRLPPSDWDYP